MSSDKDAQRARRKRRIRKHVNGTEARPRLSVFRSTTHIYAQVVDDETAVTLAAANTLQKAVEASGNKTERAKAVGQAIAKACLAKGIDKVVFDRNGFLYHGRIKALAEAAREAGLQF